MSARRSRTGAAALAALALLLMVGLTELYRLRFSSGDLYPYASSFRADPLGAKVLYESVRDLPGVVVERHQRPLADLAADRDTVVFLLGLRPADVELTPSPLLRAAEALAGRGARVVLVFAPLTGEVSPEPLERRASADEPDAARQPPGETRRRSPVWQLTTRRLALAARAEGVTEPAPATTARLELGLADLGLPGELLLHTDLTFASESLDDRARVIYRRSGEPVVIERTLGSGSVAVVADGFLFANEGLSRDRQTAFLAWALGEGRRVVFDEGHLGVEESSGVMVLARRYRLLPFLAVLAVLAGLFVWSAASGLLPAPPPAPAGSHLVAGGDAASGLAKLLARGLDPRELLPLCAERWAADCARGEKQATARVLELASQATDPVTGYRAIREALATLPLRKGDHAH
ncbi:MAG: DUF4350 domain-containing protein [Thermoanaerobaculia bacterium]